MSPQPPVRHYAASTRGFYCSDINPTIPKDAVVISNALYLSLLAAQSQGKVIQPGPDGQPVAVDAPTSPK